MSEADEPEWDEATQRFDGGLAGVSVLQIAALRNKDAAMCACLLAHGVDSASLTADAPPALRDAAHAAASDNTLAPLLVPLRGEDGEPLDCPICLAPVLALTAAWTPCAHAFHEHCLRGLADCPMCRTRLEPSARNHGQAARTELTSGQLSSDDVRPGLAVYMASSAEQNRDAALDLWVASAFSGAGGTPSPSESDPLAALRALAALR